MPAGIEALSVSSKLALSEEMGGFWSDRKWVTENNRDQSASGMR